MQTLYSYFTGNSATETTAEEESPICFESDFSAGKSMEM